MMKIKRFSVYQKTINTSGRIVGFNSDRKYDEDFDRLSRGSVKRELSGNQLNKELRKLNTELNEGRRGKWQDT